MDFFSTNKGGEPPLTLSVSERRSKASPNTPRGGVKHGGTTFSSTNKGGIRIKRSEATEGDSGKPFPVPLRAVAERLGDTTLSQRIREWLAPLPYSLRYQDSNLDRQNQNL